MFSTSFKGDFESRMKERAAKWAAHPSVSYAITYPSPELDWVYYQEFGTKSPYTISAKDGTGIAFPGRNGTVVKKLVTHPPIQATHTVGTVVEIIVAPELADEVSLAFAAGEYDPSEVRTSLIKYMESVKQEIVEEMSHSLPNTRPPDPQYPEQSGKLKGRTASEVFDENARVDLID